MKGFVEGEVVNLEMGDGSERELLKVLAAYIKGIPSVVFDNKCNPETKEGTILHGRETLEGIIAAKVGMNMQTIYGIDKGKFLASDWPEMLESARDIYMRGGTFGDSFIQFVMDGIERTDGLRGSFGQGGAQ